MEGEGDLVVKVNRVEGIKLSLFDVPLAKVLEKDLLVAHGGLDGEVVGADAAQEAPQVKLRADELHSRSRRYGKRF